MAITTAGMKTLGRPLTRAAAAPPTARPLAARSFGSREKWAAEVRSGQNEKGIFGYRSTPTPVLAAEVEKGDAARLHTTILSLRRMNKAAHSEAAKRYEQVAEAVGMRRKGRDKRFPWRPS
mmetsp:Transcript_35945/g.62142  ORF Transcript_35945/g.62142 Transcript_35945/m.62142 type:complete len:121 (+) Transcript_35945:102-464(+)